MRVARSISAGGDGAGGDGGGVPEPFVQPPAPSPRAQRLGGRRQVVPPAPRVVHQQRPPAESIDPSQWGPSLWTLLHTAAQFTTTAEQRLLWMYTVAAMMNALPCPECSAHYNAWVTANPLNLPYSGPDLTMAISSWILGLHNNVNVRKGKPTWSLGQMSAAYQNKDAALTALAALRPYMPYSFLEYFGGLL